ncbi:MAG: tetratricopeptide repeat protein, partial [Planctomycetales bacterium]|nr:tetratricopeptide repeat protein [Planctomycetales bacterium]
DKGKAFAREKPRLAALAGGGVAVVLASMIAAALMIQVSATSAKSASLLPKALEKLDEGDFRGARAIAQQMLSKQQLSYIDQGGPYFVMGVAAALEADDTPSERERLPRYIVAARFLEMSRARGFPKHRENEGLWRLGRSFHDAYQHSRAIEPLAELSRRDGPLAADAHRLLASAFFRQLVPDLRRAEEHLKLATEAQAALPSAKDDCLLLGAELALAQRDFQAARKSLAQVAEDSPQRIAAKVLEARVDIEEADAMRKSPDADAEQVAAAFAQAIDALRAIRAGELVDMQAASESSYLIGSALRRSGNPEAAVTQFRQTHRVFFETSAGLLANLEEAETLIGLGKPAEAADALALAVQQAGAAPVLSNRLAPLERLRDRVINVHEALVSNHEYKQAVQLADHLSPLVPADRALGMRAAARRAWAEHMLEAPSDGQAPPPEDVATARLLFRTAGLDYARLAKQQFATRLYPVDLWLSGKSFSDGHDFQSAVEVFQRYLETEARQERPLVLVTLARAQLSLGNYEAALASLEDCLSDFSKDPAAYEARLLASAAYAERGESAKARALLDHNLHNESLTPRSDAWRESLFALGTLLHDEGRMLVVKQRLDEQAAASPVRSFLQLEQGYDLLMDAVLKLTEATQRYPDDPKATMAMYQIAESHRYAAALPMNRLQVEAIESRRLALHRQLNDELSASLAAYDLLIARLNQRADVGELRPLDESVLRNAYFARGTALYDLGAYEKAIQAYSTATNRYQHEPAAIEAYVQIAACYRRMNMPIEARGTLEQAKLVMSEIRADAPFSATTRYDRQEWETLLNWLSSL